MAINRVISAAAQGRDLRDHVAGWRECLVSRIEDDLSLGWINPAVEEMRQLTRMPALQSAAHLPNVIRLRDENGTLHEPGEQIQQTLRTGEPQVGVVREVEVESGARFWHESTTVPILHGSRVTGVLWLSWMLGPNGQVPVRDGVVLAPLKGMRGCKSCPDQIGAVCTPGPDCPLGENIREREREGKGRASSGPISIVR